MALAARAKRSKQAEASRWVVLWKRLKLWIELIAFIILLVAVTEFSRIWRRDSGFYAANAVSNSLRNSFFGPNAQQTIMATWKPYHFWGFMNDLLIPSLFSASSERRVWAGDVSVRVHQVRQTESDFWHYPGEQQGTFGALDQYDYLPESCLRASPHRGHRGLYPGSGSVFYMHINSSGYEFYHGYRDMVKGWNTTKAGACDTYALPSNRTTAYRKTGPSSRATAVSDASTFIAELFDNGWVDNATTALVMDIHYDGMWINKAIAAEGESTVLYLGVWEFAPNRAVLYRDRINVLTTERQLVQQFSIVLALAYFCLWILYGCMGGIRTIMGLVRDQIYFLEVTRKGHEKPSLKDRVRMLLSDLGAVIGDGWPVVDAVLVILLLLAVIFSALAGGSNWTQTVDAFNHYEAARFISVQVGARRCVGLLIIVVFLKLLHFLARWFPRINMLLWVLQYSAKDAAYFSLLFALFLVGNAGMFHVVVGNLHGYSNMQRSVFAMVRALFGDFNIDELIYRAEKVHLGPNYFMAIMLLAYMFIAVFILLSMFVSIISDSWVTATHDLKFVETWNDYKALLANSEGADRRLVKILEDLEEEEDVAFASMAEHGSVQDQNDASERLQSVLGAQARLQVVDPLRDIAAVGNAIINTCCKPCVSRQSSPVDEEQGIVEDAADAAAASTLNAAVPPLANEVAARLRSAVTDASRSALERSSDLVSQLETLSPAAETLAANAANTEAVAAAAAEAAACAAEVQLAEAAANAATEAEEEAVTAAAAAAAEAAAATAAAAAAAEQADATAIVAAAAAVAQEASNSAAAASQAAVPLSSITVSMAADSVAAGGEEIENSQQGGEKAGGGGKEAHDEEDHDKKEDSEEEDGEEEEDDEEEEDAEEDDEEEDDEEDDEEEDDEEEDDEEEDEDDEEEDDEEEDDDEKAEEADVEAMAAPAESEEKTEFKVTVDVEAVAATVEAEEKAAMKVAADAEAAVKSDAAVAAAAVAEAAKSAAAAAAAQVAAARAAAVAAAARVEQASLAHLSEQRVPGPPSNSRVVVIDTSAAASVAAVSAEAFLAVETRVRTHHIMMAKAEESLDLLLRTLVEQRNEAWPKMLSRAMAEDVRQTNAFKQR